MFTGIIETLGSIVSIEREQKNIHFSLKSTLTHSLKIDQSLAHNGVCLTVVNIQNEVYTVTAIQETLEKTALHNWKIGDQVNLERAMKLGDRLDGTRACRSNWDLYSNTRTGRKLAVSFYL